MPTTYKRDTQKMDGDGKEIFIYFIKVDLCLILFLRLKIVGNGECAGIEEFYEENFILKGYRLTRLSRR